MKKLPKYLYRISDNQRFVLNPDGKTYSNEASLPDRAKGHLIWNWTYEQIINTNGFSEIK